jgi:FkbM family methyltransferase
MHDAAPGTGDMAALVARLDRIEAQLVRIERAGAEVRQLVGPFAVPMSADELLVQSLQHIKYIVPARDLVMTPQLIVYRQWEAGLSALLPRLCPPGSVFVDVGANFGYFTCLLAAHLGRANGSKVIAIEPNPDLVRLLRTNISINWSGAPVRVEPVAVASEPGTLVLHVPERSAANGSLAAPPPGNLGVQHEVQVVRLDDLLANEPRVDLLKVDVEGFEPAVFRGAVETLARPDLRLVCEWSQTQLRLAGFSPADYTEILRRFEFRLYDADAFVHRPDAPPLDDAAIHAAPYLNLLAMR